MEKINVVTPISDTAGTMSTESAANEMPTARASIEVAMARIGYSPRSIFSASLPSPSFSSSVKASHSILPPIKAKRIKAIQWSMGPMMPMN